MLYPWQNSDYMRLAEAFAKRNYTALLVYSAVNSGREQIVERLIQFMLCQAPVNYEACAKCSSCILLGLGNHPDYYQLTADVAEERKSAIIRVEQVRLLIDFASRSQHLAAVKVIFLPDASQLNLSSANALLKILEEPPAHTFFVLQVDNPNQLLPTILSRCFQYRLTMPSLPQASSYLGQVEDGEFWLRYFAGEPFFNPPFTSAQLKLLISGLLKPGIEVIFNLSRDLDPKKVGMANWLDFLLKWLSDITSLKLANDLNYFKTLQQDLAPLAERANRERLFDLLDELVFLSEWSEHPLNHKLQLENLLFKYQQIYV